VSSDDYDAYWANGIYKYIQARRQYMTDHVLRMQLLESRNAPSILQPGWSVITTNAGPHTFGLEPPQPRMRLAFEAVRPLRNRTIEVAYMALSERPSGDPNEKIKVLSEMSWHASREFGADSQHFVPVLYSE
jgi:hypothetical protein